MTLADEELRHLYIQLLTADTARDRQRTLGPSDLSNGCDFCLACKFLGISRETAIAGQTWGGRVVGTAIHGLMDHRWSEALSGESDSPILREIAARYPDAQSELHLPIGVMGTYGPIGMTTDLYLPSEQTAVDTKGTTAKKLMLLQDFMAIEQGLEPPYGRDNKWLQVSTRNAPKDTYRKSTAIVSEAVYADEMAAMAYKVTGYYGQLSLYGLGLNANNLPTELLSIAFIARDSTMIFDNPGGQRYEDPKAQHGVFILSFPYDRQYALGVWGRAESIWEDLNNGKTPADFAKSEHCFPCKMELDAEARATADVSDAPIFFNQN